MLKVICVTHLNFTYLFTIDLSNSICDREIGKFGHKLLLVIWVFSSSSGWFSAPKS